MRFRQVHLDFHTSEELTGIGDKFSKEQFQEALRLGHVDSITLFSKCHHGWSYHPTTVNRMHPGLGFDLLQAQIEAAHEMGVRTPVYLSAGLDEKIAREHPEWLIRDVEDKTNWVASFMVPGYHQLCLNSPYLDVLLLQIEEVVSRYNADGIFLDIVGERVCYCHSCLMSLRFEGRDPEFTSNVEELGRKTYANYTRRVRQVVDAIKPGLPIFHNGGHIPRGRRELALMNTHLELESLPTGGWGYDHFPLSARYVQNLGLEYLGMTGKFHTAWGEFGGFKHPNALRYETALAMANGARSSVGDQLAPNGLMDVATYTLIGAAYSNVEEREEWCINTKNISDVALLSIEAVDHFPGLAKTMDTELADAGAVRILLEGQILFDVIDFEENFSAYKLIILPDRVKITSKLKAKLEEYFEKGGKVLATGKSGLSDEGNAFNIDLLD